MLGDSAQKKILIVEDNEQNLRLLNDFLEYHGYFVFIAREGRVALDIARQHIPDLILMDIQLPDISGVEAACQLKVDEQTRSIPIIAVTAFALKDERADFLARGFDNYVSKPFSITELLKLVERYTNHPA